MSISVLFDLLGVSNLWPAGCMRPRLAMNAAQHKSVHLLKTFFFLAHQCLLVFMYLMCNVWPKTTLLLPVWPRDARSLDTPD